MSILLSLAPLVRLGYVTYWGKIASILNYSMVIYTSSFMCMCMLCGFPRLFRLSSCPKSSLLLRVFNAYARGVVVAA